MKYCQWCKRPNAKLDKEFNLLQSRLDETEVYLDQRHKEHFAHLEEKLKLREENSALRKVVDAARKHKENASHNNYVAMCNALIELDGQSK